MLDDTHDTEDGKDTSHYEKYHVDNTVVYLHFACKITK